MSLLEQIVARAKADKQRIVLPEAEEERTLKAADRVLADDIADTVHYGEVCETVRRELAGRDFLLLETLAEYLAQLVLDDFGAQWVRVRIVKPGILPAVRETGVEIERRRSA